MPVTSAVYRGYLRKACRASTAAGQTLEEYLEARLDTSSALTGKHQVQSTSVGGVSSSFYFGTDPGGAMSPTDEIEFIDWVLGQLPCITAKLETELGRPPTHDEICGAVLFAIPSGITELRLDYTASRGRCGCS